MCFVDIGGSKPPIAIAVCVCTVPPCTRDNMQHHSMPIHFSYLIVLLFGWCVHSKSFARTETFKIVCKRFKWQLACIRSGQHAKSVEFTHCCARFPFEIAQRIWWHLCVFRSVPDCLRFWVPCVLHRQHKWKIVDKRPKRLGLAQVSGEKCAILSRMWNDSKISGSHIWHSTCVVGHRRIAKNTHTHTHTHWQTRNENHHQDRVPLLLNRTKFCNGTQFLSISLAERKKKDEKQKKN